MVETVVLLEPHRKAVGLVHHPTVMVVIGVGAFLLFVSKTVGAQELSTGTVDPSGRASMERAGFGGISYPAAATQNGQATASPGQWLIDDLPGSVLSSSSGKEARNRSRRPMLHGTLLMSRRQFACLHRTIHEPAGTNVVLKSRQARLAHLQQKMAQLARAVRSER